MFNCPSCRHTQPAGQRPTTQVVAVRPGAYHTTTIFVNSKGNEVDRKLTESRGQEVARERQVCPQCIALGCKVIEEPPQEPVIARQVKPQPRRSS